MCCVIYTIGHIPRQSTVPSSKALSNLRLRLTLFDNVSECIEIDISFPVQCNKIQFFRGLQPISDSVVSMIEAS